MNHIAALFACALLLTGCSARVDVAPLAHPNPTAYSFPFPVEKVHAAALQAFSTDHQTAHPIFNSLSAGRSTLSVEYVGNAVVSKDIFSNRSNVQDIYLHAFGEPVTRSPAYLGKGGPLPFLAAFHVHLQAGGSNETTVSVTALDTQVISGRHFGFGSCGPGMANTYRPVAPTTIEEYTLLRYLGDALGVAGMPPVLRPNSRGAR